MRNVLRGGNSRVRASGGLLRPRSVRAKVVALLMVPVFSLMVLWALATVSAVQDAWTLRQLNELDAGLSVPVGEVVSSLQAERATVSRHLTESASPVSQDELTQRHARTEAAMRDLRTGMNTTSADVTSLAPELGSRVETLADGLDELRDAQPDVASGRQDWQRAFDAYSSSIQDVFAVADALVAATDSAQRHGVLPLAQVNEMLARQDAAATASQPGVPMTAAQFRAFTDAVGAQRVLGANLVPDLQPAERAAYERLLASDQYRSLRTMQDAALDNSGADHAVVGGRWSGAVDAVTSDLAAIQGAAGAAASAETAAASDEALTESLLTVIFGLLAVLVALVISVRVGRGLVVELVGLRNSALELANRRLPQAMRRLRAGEKIDVDADVPVMPPGEGEIGEVGNALNAVQRSALQAAAERAELLTGVSGVFVTLARRSQSLVHRQLALLDAMERRTDEADQLEDLFRLDHLAARMRRHAEGLIIMSGSPPGRAWREPVPLMTVVRAAVAEVEDYQRVEVLRMADVLVGGAVVADLTHMIAELVENATSFSPPNTTVLVHGEPVGSGFVVEIEDRGLGMRPESLAEANQRIASAHQLDLFDGDQLGFFVISRLAKRQGITVTLRRSAFGGITAVLLLPNSLLAQPPAQPGTAAGAREVEQVSGTLVTTRAQAARQSGTALGNPPPADPGRPQPSPVRRLPARAETAAPTARARAQPSSPAKTPARAPEPPVRFERRPRHDAAPPEPQAGQAEAATPGRHVEPGDDITGGLPRRKRQANLAPGLRRAGGAGGDTGSAASESGADGVDPRPAASPITSPEQARATMTALQQGLTRGRHG